MNRVPQPPVRRYFLRLNAEEVTRDEIGLNCLLDPFLKHVAADSAVIYRMADAEELRAIAAKPVGGWRIPELSVTLAARESQWLRHNTEPLQAPMEGDGHFGEFPESLQYGLRELLLLPLRSPAGLIGLMTVGRIRLESFHAEAVSAASRLAQVAAAVLERDSLRAALHERKVVERAKGILQQRHAFTEEDAYLHLRNRSRRMRRPMAFVAQEIIDTPWMRRSA